MVTEGCNIACDGYAGEIDAGIKSTAVDRCDRAGNGVTCITDGDITKDRSVMYENGI